MADLYIVRYPEPPLHVPRTERVTIGRAENNTIVLAEGRASRLHAMIEWREALERFVIIDVGSANGTVVNNESLPPSREHPLKDWDKVRIASTVLTIRFVESPEQIRQEFAALSRRIHSDATQVVPRPPVRPERIPASLSGDLGQLCPIELFQALETGRKTGRLTFKTPRGDGMFRIRQGMIISGRLGELQGEKAVFGSLSCDHGSFAFVSAPESAMGQEVEISQTTSALLMEGCRLLDEANKEQTTREQRPPAP